MNFYTLPCIGEMRAETVSQYSLVYCDLRAAGGLALYSNTMHSQDRQPCRDTVGWALGWEWQQARSKSWGARARRGRARGAGVLHKRAAGAGGIGVGRWALSAQGMRQAGRGSAQG